MTRPTIEGRVCMGKGNIFGYNVVLKGPLLIGDNNVILDNVVIGNAPQHRSHPQGNPNGTKIIIGNNNVIRENVSIHKPVDTVTRIHDNCFIMCNTHIPHDAEIFNDVTITSGTNLAGFVKVMQRATLGLNVSVHQHLIIGSFAMIGMGSVVTTDIPPFKKAYGNPAQIHGFNTVGIKRWGYDWRKGTDYEQYQDLIKERNRRCR
jgi:UDP-N-acetylglucosamine acyltransferase